MKQRTLTQSGAPVRVNWLDQFLTLANSTWILSKFSIFYWIRLWVRNWVGLSRVDHSGFELRLCLDITLPKNALTCFLEFVIK